MSSATIDYGDTQINTTSANVNSSADGNEEVAASGNVTFTVVESETSATTCRCIIIKKIDIQLSL